MTAQKPQNSSDAALLGGIPLLKTLLWLGLVSIAAILVWLTVSPEGKRFVQEASSRNPHELVRFAQRRLDGHPILQATAGEVLFRLQSHLERPPPAHLPHLGKGQQPLSAQAEPLSKGDWLVATPQAIRQALKDAPAGTRIVIAPGLYPFQSKLNLGNDGHKDAPITLVALDPGSVWLTFEHVDGIMVDRPYWIFENLNIRGICPNHDTCEHAFHVTGRAAHTVIRNNLLVDFNAHIKVNGSLGNWPDGGTLTHNTLTLTEPRKTEKPVVAFDLVGANDWKVYDNLVINIVKSRGERISYGMYMKGASQNGRFERNLVICTSTAISRPGIRVGISFGGGNTGEQYCRDQRCTREHINGTIQNNVIAHCNDSGVDINRSAPVLVAYNTLINTSGITTRQQPAQAQLVGNLYDGMVSSRDGTTVSIEPDGWASAHRALEDADALHMSWATPPVRMTKHSAVGDDFFKRARKTETAIGAVEQ